MFYNLIIVYLGLLDDNKGGRHTIGFDAKGSVILQFKSIKYSYTFRLF